MTNYHTEHGKKIDAMYWTPKIVLRIRIYELWIGPFRKVFSRGFLIKLKNQTYNKNVFYFA